MTALVRARTVDEAVDALADEDGHVLAGGQALTIMIKEGFVDAARLIDLAGVSELRTISTDGGHLSIGAMCSHRAVAADPAVAAAVPGLAAAFNTIGNVRVRAAGTLGGNLAHADPRQDPPPALVLLDAVALVRSADASRAVPVADLIDGALSTTLQPDELITAVEIPVLGEHEWFGFAKFLAGSSEGFATANAALRVRRAADGTIERAEATVGAVGPVAQRVVLTSHIASLDWSAPAAARHVATSVMESVEALELHPADIGYLPALCGELVGELFEQWRATAEVGV